MSINEREIHQYFFTTPVNPITPSWFTISFTMRVTWFPLVTIATLIAMNTSPALAQVKYVKLQIQSWIKACDRCRLFEEKCKNHACKVAMHWLSQPETLQTYVNLGMGSASDLDKFIRLNQYCREEDSWFWGRLLICPRLESVMSFEAWIPELTMSIFQAKQRLILSNGERLYSCWYYVIVFYSRYRFYAVTQGARIKTLSLQVHPSTPSFSCTYVLFLQSLHCYHYEHIPNLQLIWICLQLYKQIGYSNSLQYSRFLRMLAACRLFDNVSFV